ncbi:MAG: hypothetical protein HY842_06315 [Bacteroidetes bacterium]|nr:hypothetical protein [Bacteroidota bacterium]
MKRVLIILTAFYFILNACSKTNNAGTNDVQALVKDTVKIAAIDTLTNHIDKEWKPGTNFHKVMLNDRDSVEYIELNGEAQRISSKLYTDTTATWTTFHQVNNELVLVRFRQFNMARQTVKEAISYLEKGNIFYSKERFRILKEGDQLGSFREEPFVENARPTVELLAEYKPYWEITQKAVKEDIEKRK